MAKYFTTSLRVISPLFINGHHETVPEKRVTNPPLGPWGNVSPVKYWEIIADGLHAQAGSYGIAEHFTKHGFLSCVDAHRDGQRFIVKADDLLTAFLSLERDAIAKKSSSK